MHLREKNYITRYIVFTGGAAAWFQAAGGVPLAAARRALGQIDRAAGYGEAIERRRHGHLAGAVERHDDARSQRRAAQQRRGLVDGDGTGLGVLPVLLELPERRSDYLYSRGRSQWERLRSADRRG